VRFLLFPLGFVESCITEAVRYWAVDQMFMVVCPFLKANFWFYKKTIKFAIFTLNGGVNFIFLWYKSIMQLNLQNHLIRHHYLLYLDKNNTQRTRNFEHHRWMSHLLKCNRCCVIMFGSSAGQYGDEIFGSPGLQRDGLLGDGTSIIYQHFLNYC